MLAPGDIPVVPTERGGQVTYHGPGQLMAYLMLALRPRKLGIRRLVEAIEDALIDCLRHYGIDALRQVTAAVMLVAGQTVFEHVLGMKAVLSVVVEFAGGLVFLWLVLRHKKT